LPAHGGPAQNYETVNAAGTAPSGFGHGDPGWAVTGVAGRYDERGTSDDFTQAGNLFRLMTPDAKDRLTTNIATAMGSVSDDIKQRQLGHFMKADPDYGAAVATKLAALAAR
jgi:catalase